MNRKPSRRSQHEDQLKVEIARVYRENFGVYGIEKVWHQLQREGVSACRDRAARLMDELGLEGVVCGKRQPITTVTAQRDTGPADLVERDFTATAPNMKWVADPTYVSTWSGFVYVAFVIDVHSRFIVGWRVLNSLRTDLA
jgi:putative transposase